MTTEKILVNLKDIDAVFPTKEQYLKGLKHLCKDGWTITAEKYRKSYNRLCLDKKNKILKNELVGKNLK